MSVGVMGLQLSRLKQPPPCPRYAHPAADPVLQVPQVGTSRGQTLDTAQWPGWRLDLQSPLCCPHPCIPRPLPWDSKHQEQEGELELLGRRTPGEGSPLSLKPTEALGGLQQKREARQWVC